MMTTFSLPSNDQIAFAGCLVVGPEVPPSDQESSSSTTTNPLERLIQITQANDRLLAELATTRCRLRQAFEYAGDQASRSDLSEALMAHTRRKRARILGQLQANRSEALAILAGGVSSR